MKLSAARQMFDAFCAKKTARASAAEIPGYKAAGLNPHQLLTGKLDMLPRNGWVRRLYDGPFFYSKLRLGRPTVNGVFVQDANGNTDTASGNPGDLGGGETDLHLIYEGLTRVDVDAVLAGAGTIRGWGGFFSVWRPELVKMRMQQCGRTRHPAQIIVSGSGNLDLANELIFNLPLEEFIPVYVLTTKTGEERIRAMPWGEERDFNIINTGPTLNLEAGLSELGKMGFQSISAVGGRTTMTALFDHGLIDDFYLTTSPATTGLPDTPYYVGKNPPQLALVVDKKGIGSEEGVIFKHFVIKK